jgi:hypothetical protein
MDAEAHTQVPVAGTAISGFARAEVDQFLDAAQTERRRLEAEIAEAHARISRARSAIGMHRVMVSMLLEAQREFAELRQQAETEAQQIAIEAERKVAEILAPKGEGGTDTETIDLTLPAQPDQPARVATPSGTAAATEGVDKEYFDFLRGALADESPLGPGAE